MNKVWHTLILKSSQCPLECVHDMCRDLGGPWVQNWADWEDEKVLEVDGTGNVLSATELNT